MKQQSRTVFAGRQSVIPMSAFGTVPGGRPSALIDTHCRLLSGAGRRVWPLKVHAVEAHDVGRGSVRQ